MATCFRDLYVAVEGLAEGREEGLGRNQGLRLRTTYRDGARAVLEYDAATDHHAMFERVRGLLTTDELARTAAAYKIYGLPRYVPFWPPGAAAFTPPPGRS